MFGLVTLVNAACFVAEADIASSRCVRISLRLSDRVVVTVDTLLQVAHLRLELGLALVLTGEHAASLVDHAGAISAIQEHVDFTAVPIIPLKYPGPRERFETGIGERVEFIAGERLIQGVAINLRPADGRLGRRCGARR